MEMSDLEINTVRFENKNVILSIITVTKNDKNRLAITIGSLRYYYGNNKFEHIVMDGSTNEETKLFLKKKCHENLRLVSEHDNGIYDAMNKGAQLAVGRFLLFLNCGDEMSAPPEKVELWLSSLGIYDNLQIACFCSLVRTGSNYTKLFPSIVWPYQLPTSHQAMVFTKEFIKHNPYNISYKIAADFDLYLKAEVNKTVIFSCDEPLTTIESVGVASNNPFHSYKEYLKIISENLIGTLKWLALTRIGTKALVVIALKCALPSRWVQGLRKLN